MTDGFTFRTVAGHAPLKSSGGASLLTSYTTGTIGPVLVSVRCAHRPCLASGRGHILTELSPDHEHITVTALTRREAGYRQIDKCKHCGNWNGINYSLRQQAA